MCLTLDVSLAHIEGQRRLSVVKEQLIDFVRNTMEGEDLFYLYHPEIIEPVYDVGKIVSHIGNYETNGWKFDLRQALKLAYYVMAAQDEDAEKMLLFVTDRIIDRIAIKKLLLVEEREQTDCRFVFVGIGTRYDKLALQLTHDQVTYIHLDSASDLNATLLEKLGHENNI